MHFLNGVKCFGILIALFSIFTQGCVTKASYKAKLDENQSIIENLEMEHNKKVSLESEIEGAQNIILDKENQIVTLEQQLETKNQEIDQLMNGLSKSKMNAEKKQKKLDESEKTHKSFIKKLQNEINDGSVKISQLKDRLSVEIIDKILFDSGSAKIKNEGVEVLKKVSEILKDVHDNLIRIEGHTDNVPISSGLLGKYPSNWELSASRATQVTRYLVANGVLPQKLEAVALSEYRPITSNDTEKGQQHNRRIEIILFPNDVQEIAASVL